MAPPTRDEIKALERRLQALEQAECEARGGLWGWATRNPALVLVIVLVLLDRRDDAMWLIGLAFGP